MRLLGSKRDYLDMYLSIQPRPEEWYDIPEKALFVFQNGTKEEQKRMWGYIMKFAHYYSASGKKYVLHKEWSNLYIKEFVLSLTDHK